MKFENSLSNLLSKAIPIHDLGQALSLASYITIVSAIFYQNVWIISIILIVSVIGMSIANIHLGLWVDSITFNELEYRKIRHLLLLEPKVFEISPNCWAPRRYQPWIWKSSWLIIKQEGLIYRLTARERDIRVLAHKYSS
jgi:hypothetical protein